MLITASAPQNNFGSTGSATLVQFIENIFAHSAVLKQIDACTVLVYFPLVQGSSSPSMGIFLSYTSTVGGGERFVSCSLAWSLVLYSIRTWPGPCFCPGSLACQSIPGGGGPRALKGVRNFLAPVHVADPTLVGSASL